MSQLLFCKAVKKPLSTDYTIINCSHPQVYDKYYCPKDPWWWKSGLWCKAALLNASFSIKTTILIKLDTFQMMSDLDLIAGHPQEASGERSVWAAVSNRSSLYPEEERGGGAHCPREQNCECVPGRGVVVVLFWSKQLYPFLLQEKRRAERAEQHRIRAEKEKERQTRLAVWSQCKLTYILTLQFTVPYMIELWQQLFF